jgi:hypothetical protein
MFVEALRILIAALHLRGPVVFPSDGNNLDGVINLPGLPIRIGRRYQSTSSLFP